MTTSKSDITNLPNDLEGIFSLSWRTFKKYFTQVFPLFLLLSIPVIAYNIWYQHSLQKYTPSLQEMFMQLGYTLLFSIVFAIIPTCFLLIFIYNKLTGKETSIKQALTQLKNRYLYILITQFLLLASTVIGTFLFIIPGLIISTFGIFTPYIVANTEKSFYSAFKESYRLTSGRFWTVFGYSMLFGMILTIPTTIISLIPTSLIGILKFSNSNEYENIIKILNIASITLPALITTILNFWFIIATTIWYLAWKDQKDSDVIS
jgi:hypothetical protein